MDEAVQPARLAIQCLISPITFLYVATEIPVFQVLTIPAGHRKLFHATLVHHRARLPDRLAQIM